MQSDSINNVMHVQTRTKWFAKIEDSSILCHGRLGHISNQRIKRLVNDWLLDILWISLIFETCVSCIKGNETNKYKKDVKRSFEILEIICSDICFPHMDIPNMKYFISFNDDY